MIELIALKTWIYLEDYYS